jgi:hypothetical protein
LQYTDYTRKSLIKLLAKVRDEITDKVSEEFKNAETLFDAKCLYGTVFDYGNNLYQLKDVVKDSLKWNGKKVEDDNFSCYNHNDIALHKFEKSSRGYRRFRPNEKQRISCNKQTVVIYNDVGHRRGVLGKILPLAETQGKNVYLIGTATHLTTSEAKATWKKFIDDEKFDAKLINLSTLTKHKLSEFDGYTNAAGTGNGPKNNKHSEWAFSLDWKAVEGTTRGYGYGGKSQYWKTVELDVKNSSGVYVIIDKFEIETNCGEAASYQWSHGTVNPCSMNGLRGSLKKIGLKLPKVFAVKVAKRHTIENKDGWVNLFDWIETGAVAQIEKKKLAQKFLDRKAANDALCGKWRRNPTTDDAVQQIRKFLVAPERSLYEDWFAKVDEMLNNKDKDSIDAFIDMKKDFGFVLDTDLKPTYDLDSLADEVEKRYSVLDLLDCWSSWNWDKKSGKKIANYINVIDVCNASDFA